MVGKNLMMHPFATVTGPFGAAVASWQGTAAQRAYSLELAKPARTGVFIAALGQC